MTRRTRRERRRQMRIEARRRGYSDRTLSTDFSSSCLQSDGSPKDSSVKRALFIGGTKCFIVGVVFLISHDDSGYMKIIVLMLGYLVATLANTREDQEVDPDDLVGVTVQRPGTRLQQQPQFRSYPRVVNSYAPAVYVSSQLRDSLSPRYTPISRQPSGYFPGDGFHVTGYHTPTAFSGQTSTNHVGIGGHLPYYPAYFVGQNSRNPSPIMGQPLQYPYSDRNQTPVIEDDPPSYHSVANEQPWENPPSYQEASLCLSLRRDDEESSSPSAPDISNFSAHDVPTPTSSRRSSVACDPIEPENLSSLPHNL